MTRAARHILFIIDPINTLATDADSSFVMISEAISRGHQVSWCETKDLFVQNDNGWAHVRQIELNSPLKGSTQKFQTIAEHTHKLDEFAVILMRKDPPFDENYLLATWCLDYAGKNTWVINDPNGLRSVNEKLAILHFPSLIPPTRILRRKSDLHQTLSEFGGQMVVKPVFGFGGREVLRVSCEDPNLNTLFELATHDEQRWTVAQAFVPEANTGDKRILLVDGEPIGAVLRVPAIGDLRGNFHAGGSPTETTLNPRDLEICRAIKPFLRQHGQFFAGIDVIGSYLTEINVTSPTGMQEINRLGALSGQQTMQAQFWSRIERKLERS